MMESLEIGGYRAVPQYDLSINARCQIRCSFGCQAATLPRFDTPQAQ